MVITEAPGVQQAFMVHIGQRIRSGPRLVPAALAVSLHAPPHDTYHPTSFYHPPFGSSDLCESWLTHKQAFSESHEASMIGSTSEEVVEYLLPLLGTSDRSCLRMLHWQRQ